MAFVVKGPAGYSGSRVVFTSAHEFAYVCGNAVVIRDVQSGKQKLLHGTSFGVQDFAASIQAGIIAVAEKGISPAVHIYNSRTLQRLRTISPGFDLGVTCLALSHDGQRLALLGQAPQEALHVYAWNTEELLVSSAVPGGVASPASASFHPYDHDRLLTTVGGNTLSWKIQRLWEKKVIKHVRVTLSSAESHTAHVWSPAGAFLGTASGRVHFVPLKQLATEAAAAGASATRSRSSSPQHNARRGGGTPVDHVLSTRAKPTTPTAGNDSLEEVPSELLTNTAYIDVHGPDGPITHLSLSRDLLIVAGPGELSWFVHGPRAAPSPAPIPFYSHPLGDGVTVLGQALGGAGHAQLVAGCSNGRVLLLTGPTLPAAPWPPTAAQAHDEQNTAHSQFDHDDGIGAAGLAHQVVAVNAMHSPRGAMPAFLPPPPPTVAVLVDAHVGRVTGMVPHPSADAVISCGEDGSVRVWEATTGKILACRVCAAALTTMTAAPRGTPLLAVGSQTGVVRLIVPSSTGPGPVSGASHQPLTVTWRTRLHTSAVTSMAFSPDASVLATAGEDRSIWFMAVDVKEGTATVIGQVACPEPILCLAWPDKQEGDDWLVVSLASGAMLAASVVPELFASRKPASGPELHLGPKEVSMKVVKLETSLLTLVSVPGESYGELLGLGADGHVHQIGRPVERQAWAGLKGRVHKSYVRAPVHARPGGTLSLSPNAQLLATGSHDGTIATHTTSLMTLGTLAGRPAGGTHHDASGTLAAFRGGLKAGIHDITADGVSAIAFDRSGRYLVSAGTDGSAFVYEIQGSVRAAAYTAATAAGAAKPSERASPGAAKDVDAWDDPSESTAAVAIARQRAVQQGKQRKATSHSSTAVASRLQELREALADCVSANLDAPDLEKLSRTELLVDRALHAQLLTDADQHIAHVRQDLKRSNASLEVVAARIKASCWAGMEVKGERLAGIADTTVMVPSFALCKEEPRRKALAKVVFLRRMEILEQRQSAAEAAAARALGNMPPPGAPATGSDATGGQPEAPPRRSSFGGGLDLEPADELLDAWAAAGPKLDLEPLMYRTTELRTVLRKATQIHLLQQMAVDMKLAFNAEWEKLVKQKQTDAEKIADLNGRLEEVVKELGRLGAAAPNIDELRFTVHFPEDMRHVLEVRDDEVLAPRPEDSASHDGLGPGGVGGAAGMAGGEAGAGERALRQMMGGTLAPREEPNTEFLLIKPSWMEGNPKLFSTEQMKEFKEYQIKERIMAEEKAKRISTLEQEMRGVSTAIEDCAAHFDAQLQGLDQRRARALGEVAGVESRILTLSAALNQALASDDAAIRDVVMRMSAAQEQRSKLMNEISDKKHLLSEVEAQFTETSQEDKSLERNFKKEFGTSDEHYAQLLHLFRLRIAGVDKERDRKAIALASCGPAAGSPGTMQSRSLARTLSSAADPAAVANATGHSVPATPLDGVMRHPALLEAQGTALDAWPPLPTPVAALLTSSSSPPGTLPPHIANEPEELDDMHAPDDLSADIWNHLKSYRAAKIRCEKQLHALASKLVVLRTEVWQLETATDALQVTADVAMQEAQRIQAARKAALVDCEIQLRLKAGQVEVWPEPDQLEATDAEAALLVHRQQVEALNAAVKSKGARKVAVLQQIKEFCRGTHMVKWEAARCEMMIADLREKVRDLQLLHVTREMQVALQSGAEARAADKVAAAAQQASLEALARQREKLHAKTMLDRDRMLRMVDLQISQQALQNTEVGRHLVGLQKVLEEQQRLRGSLGDTGAAANKKMRSLVTHKKLKDIAMAQAQEVQTLAAQLDALRLRSYPTFIEASATGLPADTRLPPALPLDTSASRAMRGSRAPGSLPGLSTAQPGSPLRQ